MSAPETHGEEAVYPTTSITVDGVDKEMWEHFREICRKHEVTTSQKIRQMIWDAVSRESLPMQE